jgi:linoleoyl-CoA desaturase
MNAPKFTSSSVSLHNEFKTRVNNYFQKAGIPPTGNTGLHLKAVMFLLCYIAVYINVVFFTPTSWIAISECILLGLLTAAVGFNVMHDGGHGSFSKSKLLNKLAAMSLDFMGASSYMWNTKHNVVHHAYTNIDGVDDDINAGALLRLCETQKYYKAHRFQYLYVWLLYSQLYVFWVFYTDYKKYFTGKISDMPIPKLSLSDHIIFWSSKVMHLIFFIILPIFYCGLVPWFIGFMIYGSVSGLVLSTVFQLAHTVEETVFPEAIQPENKIEDEWALHQLKTTANFATHNRLVTWYVGGLNFQIEHHLFPKISHIHYPAINRIVRATCKELNVVYIEHPKVSQAIASHIAHLKRMGRVA